MTSLNGLLRSSLTHKWCYNDFQKRTRAKFLPFPKNLHMVLLIRETALPHTCIPGCVTDGVRAVHVLTQGEQLFFTPDKTELMEWSR